MARIELSSPVTGTVWKIERKVGDVIQEGDAVMILESMKMEIPLEAVSAGMVSELRAELGVSVEEGQVLCVIES